MTPDTSKEALAFGPDAPINQVMSTMRAMRRLKPDPVPPELLTKLVEAATWGPSGSNAQAYQYVVVTDRAQIAAVAKLWTVVVDFYLAAIAPAVPPGSTEQQHEKLRRALRYQRDHFHETPAIIVACYRTGPYERRLGRHILAMAKAFQSAGPVYGLKIALNSPTFMHDGVRLASIPV